MCVDESATKQSIWEASSASLAPTISRIRTFVLG